ncbi:hypothetical protein MMC11_006638 [Xylographa trunciseda]|nr:hypothetical protein [Xylographa trunciseda]
MRSGLRAIIGVILAGTFASCSPLPIFSQYTTKDHHPVPEYWICEGTAPLDHVIRLKIGLRSAGSNELERHLHEISDPSHSRYGQHLSEVEVRSLTAPDSRTHNLVERWLQEHGIEDPQYNLAKDWITVSIPVRTVNRLLNTEYQVYRHLEEPDEPLIRTSHWSLPIHLHRHIDVIQPTNSFFRPRSRRSQSWKRDSSRNENDIIKTYEELKAEDLAKKPHIVVPEAQNLPPHPTVAQACNRFAVSPLCLRTLYGTLDYVPQAAGKNKMALVNFLDIGTNRSDIGLFLERFRPDAVDAAQEFSTELVNGALDDQSPNTAMPPEGNLDVEAILGVAYPTPLISYNVKGKPPFKADNFTTKNTNEPYLEWLQYVLAKPELPQVISLSYADDEQTVPYSYAKRVCEGFAQLGARGVSILVGSGDEGVGRNGTCFSNDDAHKKTFMPKFPASCPYVTAVGSTRYFEPERVGFDARNDFVSGGGFSNYFPRATFQQEHVGRYLTDHLKSEHNGLYNSDGRGIPDISAMGYHYPVVWNGTAHLIDGTSASAPAVAGIIALVNDALIAEGKPPLGFLNPWLYKNADAFSDVTIGSNRGCDTKGFPAAEGWDAATGLGTPWFPELKERALASRFRQLRPWPLLAAEDRDDPSGSDDDDSSTLLDEESILPSSVKTEGDESPKDPFKPFDDLPDEDRNILTFRALLVGVLCGALVNASNIYLGLKSGWTASANIFASIVGFTVLKSCARYAAHIPLLGGDFGPRENNIVQTAATAAGGMSNVFVSAFPALYQLGLMESPVKDFWRITTLTAVGGYFGYFFATPLRKFFIIYVARELHLIFPSSSATAFTIRSMHQAGEGESAQRKMRVLFYAFCFAFAIRVLSQYATGILWDWHPFTWLFLLTNSKAMLAVESWAWYIEWTPAFIGSGMGIIGPILSSNDVAFGIPKTDDPPWLGLTNWFSLGEEFTSALHPSPRYWLLWPGILCMVAVSLTELLCQWRIFWLSGRAVWRAGREYLTNSRKSYEYDAVDDKAQSKLIEDPAAPEDQVKIWMWLPGLLTILILTCLVTYIQYGMAIGETCLALLLTFFFSFLAIQATGATDITPLTGASKASQIILGTTTKGQGWTIETSQRMNLLGGALTSIGANQAADLAGDFRVGFLLRTSPKLQWFAQGIGTFCAVFIAPATFVLFATAYPCINDAAAETCAFQVPSVSAWRAVAVAVTNPTVPIPVSSRNFAIAFAALGGVMAVVRHAAWTGRWEWVRRYHPNMMVVSLAFVIPATVYGTAMLMGACVAAVWSRRHPKSFTMYGYAVAAGFMAGEGIGGVMNAILQIAGLSGDVWGTGVGCPGRIC